MYENDFPTATDKIQNEKFHCQARNFAIIFCNTSGLFSTFIAEAILNNRACLIMAFL